MGFRGKYLCGGLSYSSLDYFHSGIDIPITQTAPEPGNILNEYLLGRQIDAHKFAIPNLIGDELVSNAARFESCISLSDDFGRVARQIDRGRPIPIVLIDIEDPLSTSSHWVVVIGYDVEEFALEGRRCGRLYIYDSNFPEKRCFLQPNARNTRFAHSRGGAYRAYIANLNFGPRNLNNPRYRPLHGLPPLPPRRSNGFVANFAISAP